MSSVLLPGFEAHPPGSWGLEQVVTRPHGIEPGPFDVPLLLCIPET